MLVENCTLEKGEQQP